MPAASSSSSSSSTRATRWSADSRTPASIDAYVNAYHVIDLERSLGTFFEPGFQQALIEHTPWLVDFANFMYLNSHFVITTGFLAWLYLFRNEHFYFVRNMFLVAMGLALVGYALFPTAPPRLLPGEGFTDTISAFTGVAQDSKTASLLLNQYAAVPSMHIAFSLMVAVPAAMLSQPRDLTRDLVVLPAARPLRDRRHRATTTGSTPSPVRSSPASRRSPRSSSPACARPPGHGRRETAKALTRGSVRPSSADGHNRGRRRSGAATRATA